MTVSSDDDTRGDTRNGARPKTTKMKSKRVRPYALTGGRTWTRHHLLVETLISVPEFDPVLAESLMPESRLLYTRACQRMSIAELSATLTLPLGVVRVLISDLAGQNAVFIHPTAYAYQNNPQVLERILDGLKQLPV
ncbi:DUF742 domain-containing protein [Actinophytocola sp.]|uniref:DUF742 domain-containing protein n=1 Tax=Actinophytocola sp. TaxID=1872138 RepID=UPI0039C8AB2D